MWQITTLETWQVLFFVMQCFLVHVGTAGMALWALQTFSVDKLRNLLLQLTLITINIYWTSTWMWIFPLRLCTTKRNITKTVKILHFAFDTGSVLEGRMQELQWIKPSDSDAVCLINSVLIGLSEFLLTHINIHHHLQLHAATLWQWCDSIHQNGWMNHFLFTQLNK